MEERLGIKTGRERITKPFRHQVTLFIYYLDTWHQEVGLGGISEVKNWH